MSDQLAGYRFDKNEFNEPRAKMSPQARAKFKAIYSQFLKEMPLAQLRRARGLS